MRTRRKFPAVLARAALHFGLEFAVNSEILEKREQNESAQDERRQHVRLHRFNRLLHEIRFGAWFPSVFRCDTMRMPVQRAFSSASDGRQQYVKDYPPFEKDRAEAKMKGVLSHARLLPWYVGAAIIAVATGIIGLFFVDEGAPELAQQAVLVTAPLVYLTLTYLVFRSEP